MPYGTNDLLNKSRAELDALFAQSPPGPIPNGDAKGTAILDPGSPRDALIAALAIGIPLLIALVLLMRFLPYRPVNYTNIVDQFKYGSTGGERNAGFPYWIWQALPVVFEDKLPHNGRPGYEAFGFVYETDAQNRRRDLPVGVMRA